MAKVYADSNGQVIAVRVDTEPGFTTVAAATSPANLQTRVAALANMPDRTLQQAATAINNKLDSGVVD